MGLNTVPVSYRRSNALSVISNVKLVGLQLVSVIPTVICGIPSPEHTFNPESGADFALKYRVLSFK